MRLRPSVESAGALDLQLKQADHPFALGAHMSNWSKAIGGVLGVAAINLAHRLGVSQSAVTQLEQNQASG